MKRTCRLIAPETIMTDAGKVQRMRVTVTPYARVWERYRGRLRTVWADVDDDSALYVLYHGILWPWDGPQEVLEFD